MGIAFPDELGRVALELLQTELYTVFHHHLEAARLAEAADRRGDDDNDQGFLDPRQLAVEVGDDVILVEGFAPIFPALVHDERRGDIGDVGEIQDREASDVDPGIDPYGFLQDGVDLLRHLYRSRLGSAFGEVGPRVASTRTRTGPASR